MFPSCKLSTLISPTIVPTHGSGLSQGSRVKVHTRLKVFRLFNDMTFLTTFPTKFLMTIPMEFLMNDVSDE